MTFEYLQKETTRHGRQVYYVRLRGKKRQRIKLAPDDPLFPESYKAALEAAIISQDFTIQRSIEKILVARFRNARARDVQRGRITSINQEWVVRQIRRQNYKCAITGVRFSDKVVESARINPFSPSIDRIDNARGYETGNVRIVIFAVNMMMLDWGLSVFDLVATEYTKNKNGPHLELGAGGAQKSLDISTG